MVIPAGVLKYVDRDDLRASGKAGSLWGRERVSAILVGLWLEERMNGRTVDECRGLWSDLGWSQDSQDTISRRVYRVRRGEPFLLLARLEDWLTFSPYGLFEVAPQAAVELQEEADLDLAGVGEGACGGRPGTYPAGRSEGAPG